MDFPGRNIGIGLFTFVFRRSLLHLGDVGNV